MCSYACATHSGVPWCGSNVTRTFSAVGCRGSRRAMTASWLPLQRAITRHPDPLVGRLETRHHTRGVVEPAECFSRTLSAGLQLLRQCKDASLRCSSQGFLPFALMHDTCTQKLPEQVSDVPVCYSLLNRFH